MLLIFLLFRYDFHGLGFFFWINFFISILLKFMNLCMWMVLSRNFVTNLRNQEFLCNRLHEFIYSIAPARVRDLNHRPLVIKKI